MWKATQPREKTSEYPPRPLGVAHRLGGDVGRGGHLHQLLDVDRPAGALDGLASLPVHHPEFGLGRLRVQDQDVLRGEAAVDQAPPVGVGQDLGELADQAEPGPEVQALTAEREVLVQALGLEELVEEQCGAVLVLLVAREQRLGAQEDGGLQERELVELRARLLAAEEREQGLSFAVGEVEGGCPSARRRRAPSCGCLRGACRTSS